MCWFKLACLKCLIRPMCLSVIVLKLWELTEISVGVHHFSLWVFSDPALVVETRQGDNHQTEYFVHYLDCMLLVIYFNRCLSWSSTWRMGNTWSNWLIVKIYETRRSRWHFTNTWARWWTTNATSETTLRRNEWKICSKLPNWFFFFFSI